MTDDGQKTRPALQGPDVERERLRALVETIDREISALAATARLKDSWADLVNLLGLGPAPEVRECPNCRRFAMRAATLCGYCWAKLPPLAGTQERARPPSTASDR